MAKKLKSEQSESYFQNLPDDLVILIFTKLSSNSSDPRDTLDDIKLLGQCSTVCQRFNSLTCLVPTLSINNPSCKKLYDYCPKILKKFKHIRSLQVKHWSCTEIRMHNKHKDLPIVLWDAAYRPHSYCLVVVSYKDVSDYSDQQGRESIMQLSDTAAAEEDYNSDFNASNREHTIDLIHLHHMLVSSIKDHKYLQRVVVTDFYNGGTLTLEEDMLVELRNCSSTNLEQIQKYCDLCGSFIDLDIPNGKMLNNGIILNNICFNIIEWSEKATDDDHIHKDAAAGDIPSGLPFKGSPGALLKDYLRHLLKDPPIVFFNAKQTIRRILHRIKAHGNLL